jgi:hypothetical protein
MLGDLPPVDPRMLAWIDQRIADIFEAPDMWGSVEVVDMQLLLLHELRCMSTAPAALLANPKMVLEGYIAFVWSLFPRKPHQPLFLHLDPDNYADLVIAWRHCHEHLLKLIEAKVEEARGT